MNQQADDFERSLKRINTIVETSEGVQKSYGRFALTLPSLIHRHPLAHVVGFIDEHCQGDDHDEASNAARHIRTHVADILDVAVPALLEHTRRTSAIDDLFETDRLLDCWNYHARFAVVLLGVQLDEE